MKGAEIFGRLEKNMTTTGDFDSTAAAAARLKSAREQAGFRSARAFAKSANFKPTTYNQHETGKRTLRRTHAEAYAPKLRVDADWLLTGKVNSQLPNNGNYLENSHVIMSVPLLDTASLDTFIRIKMGDIPRAPDNRSEPVPSKIYAGPRTYALSPTDNALASGKPALTPDAIVYLDPDAEQETGDVVAAVITGYPRVVLRKFKQIVGRGGRAAFELLSLDPDYASFSSEEHEINLVGKMIGIWLPVMRTQ